MPQSSPIDRERIAALIHRIRGQQVMIDADLASLYEVETRALVQAVKRNRSRFPEDFMFQLTKRELDNWRSQFVMSNPALKMGLRRRPYVFTEHGVAMLSSVLRSERAVQANIEIIRAFVGMRRILGSHKDLAAKLEKLEARITGHDEEIALLFQAIRGLMAPKGSKKSVLGFQSSPTE